MVYDTGDPQKPLEKEWFELKRHDARWKKDLDGRAENRCYAAEHVLEWQLLRDFIEADKHIQQSRCAHLEKWFLEDMPKGKSHKVKVAKDNGRLGTNNRFDFEDQDFTLDEWKNDALPIPRLIEWICKYYPAPLCILTIWIGILKRCVIFADHVILYSLSVAGLGSYKAEKPLGV
jgi:hypothetical protein